MAWVVWVVVVWSFSRKDAPARPAVRVTDLIPSRRIKLSAGASNRNTASINSSHANQIRTDTASHDHVIA